MDEKEQKELLLRLAGALEEVAECLEEIDDGLKSLGETPGVLNVLRVQCAAAHKAALQCLLGEAPGASL